MEVAYFKIHNKLNNKIQVFLPLVVGLDKNLINLNNQLYLVGKLVAIYLDKINNPNNSKNQLGYLEVALVQQHQLHKIQLFLNHHSQHKAHCLDSHHNNNQEDYFRIFNHQISNHNKVDFLVSQHNLQVQLNFNSLNNKDYLVNLSKHHNK